MKHVLVVEDDPYNATLFRKVIEKRAGFQVTVSEDGAEILRLARAGDVHLIVLDISLRSTSLDGRPVNGVELCKVLKSDPLTVGIPVLLATAHAMRGDGERLLAESGADDYVSKPIVDHAAFAEQVRVHLSEAA
ncbi:MAG: response regulator [Candidatus Eisenbacteria bacterium]